MTLAHVAGGSSPLSTALGGGGILVLTAGVGLIILWRHRHWSLRGAGGVLVVLGVGAVIASEFVAPPKPPQYRLAFSEPAPPSQVAGRLALQLCARYPNGDTTPLPESKDWLDLSVDGRAVQETRSPLLALNLPLGPHNVTVQLVTEGHRAYDPPVRLTAAVTVLPDRPSHGPPPCRR